MRRGVERVVILGQMSRYPVAGMVWLTMQYVVGFARLGHDVWYVEVDAGDAAYVDRMMRRFGLDDRWAIDMRRSGMGCAGRGAEEVDELYRSAALIVNLHGGTKPLEQHTATGRLLYLETDPGELAADVQAGAQGSIDFLGRHAAFSTWAENYRGNDCLLPRLGDLEFTTTRQPVLVDAWQAARNEAATHFTTIGNWRQPYREVVIDGRTYYWSKHLEFLRFIDLPERTPQQLELALASYDDEDLAMLRQHGWTIRPAASVSEDPDAYQRYIAGSRGEFTVAKEQYARLRTGWMGDRSPTYLAAGRPVILQDTGFPNVLPTGEGLFAFSTIDDVLAAVESIDGDYERHARAAREIAREYFAHDVVLPPLLETVAPSRRLSPPG